MNADTHASNAWRLEILEGPNAGADLALSHGPHRLGVGAGNDIVLSDPDIAAEHFSLTISDGGATLVAHAPGVGLQRRVLGAGERQKLGSRNDIRLGNTVMRVHGPAGRGSSLPGLPGLPGRSVCLGLGAAGLAVAALTFAAGAPGVRAPASAAPTEFAPAPTAAAGALTARIREAGLGSALSVSGSGAALIVSGILPAHAAPVWHGVRTWFDATYATRVALLERFDAPAVNDQPPLDIAAVALTPVPLVVARDGARYTEGAVLPGGWIVDKITGAGVTLSRNGHALRMTL